MTIEKTYIGKVEAFEIALGRNCDLPTKNQEILTVHAIVTGLPIQVLGKDNKGFYLSEYDN